MRGRALAEDVAAHALVWLVAGAAAGLWMATLLLAPRAGEPLGELGYGRWAALHLDLTLYGWLALPIVGLLFTAFGVERRPGAGRAALALWSGALAGGAISWLTGRSSGKLFLDWSGGAALGFALAQLALLAVLILGFATQLAGRAGERPRRSWLGRAALLALLAVVPAALVAAESPGSYPPIDPASGGPTGNSLLGSTLALVAALLAVPRLAGLEARRAERRGPGAPALLALHFLIFLALGFGDRGNDEPVQLAALASSAVWAALLPRDLARFTWPPGTRRWLAAAAAWGAILLATGLVQYLPAALERAKFTHLLVAHAHLATAGFASACAAAMLQLGLAATPRARLLVEPVGFWLWHGATALHVVALAGLGALEAADPSALLRGGAAIDRLLALRWLAGAGMLAAAVRWLAGALGRSRPTAAAAGAEAPAA
jgi:cytochrome c oxidase cbb3-type subunit 1